MSQIEEIQIQMNRLYYNIDNTATVIIGIEESAQFIDIVFPIVLNFIPKIHCQVLIPSEDSEFILGTPIYTTISKSGFSVALSSPTPDATYKLQFDITK